MPESAHDPTRAYDPSAPASLGEAIHTIILQFDQAWRDGPPPNLPDFLPPDGPVRDAALPELVRIDEERRRAAGLPPRTDEYRAVLGNLTGVFVPQPEPGPTARNPAVPGYQVYQEVARGGMGVVYAARDEAFGREVAIKTVRPDAATDTAAARFEAEAALTGRLEHPGIPPAYALGILADGRPYLVMKLIRGRTLQDLLAARPSPAADLPRLLPAFEQVCQAVGYAHSRGVIHRDLKPQNVMVGEFGEVQVMDWGLARAEGGGGRADPAVGSCSALPPPPSALLTQDGQVLGSPPYMPPEQARGEWDRVDARADVFGLGGILCHVLTGAPPFTGKSRHEVMDRARAASLDDAVARLGESGADPQLIDLCQRCLAPDPAGRPADAREVAEAVAAYRAGVEERARKAEAERAAAEAKADEQRKRRRVQLLLAATVGLVLVAGGALAWWWDRDATARAVAERGRVTRNADALVALVGRCEDTLRAGDGAAARDTLAEIDRRIPDGGADELGVRIDRCRTDLAVLRELDAFDQYYYTLVGGSQPRPAEFRARRLAAFEAVGLSPSALAPDEFARRVAGSLLRERVISALESWLVLDYQDAGRKQATGVRNVLRAVDPHPYRDAVRDAVVAGDDGRVAELAARPEALAQPPGFAAALGQCQAVPIGRRREVLEQAVQPRPGDLNLLLGLYFLGRGEQDTGAALRWAQAAVAAHPRNAIAREALGVALGYTGDFDRAAAELREAIRIAPDFIGAYFNLATALGNTGDVDGAVAVCREALCLQPNNAWILSLIGKFLVFQGDTAGAVEATRKAVGVAPDVARFHTLAGTALYEAGDWERAVAACREGVRLAPADAEAHHALGRAFMGKPQPGKLFPEKSDLDGAFTASREAVRLAPANARFRSDLGTLLVARNDLDGAIQEFKEAVRLDPKLADAHKNLAIVYWRQNKYPQAAAAARTAIRLDPNSKDAYGCLGVAQWSMKNFVEGRRNLALAVKDNPNPTWGLYANFSVLEEDRLAPPPREVKR